ncbi:MAG: hypothetical protein DHS20C17_13980 [Cyclobacteriaceae bacterium]|nr:MAG: hypothetical protein DHS20C17_13980 [Cyclobacteriaceae bacterium]
MVLLFPSYDSFAQKSQIEVEKRGVVVYPSDLTSVGCEKWVNMANDAGLNVIALHSDTRLETLPKLKAFLESEQGEVFLAECKKYGINVEYELHILMELLPRQLFNQHPDFFRVDKNGKRNSDYNMCFTSKEALKIVKKNVVEMAHWIKPTSHRYFFWTDDVQLYCNCTECGIYSPSEQVLLYENSILEALKEYDPKATVAHLAYVETVVPPEKVKPLPGIFLEFAPIQRDYSKPLNDKLKTHLKINLEIFPPETAQILEYWLDVSMFSDWKSDKLVKIPCSKEQCRRDVVLYESMGIKSITTFGAWINGNYIQKFGEDYSRKILREYGEVLNNE